MAFSRATYNTTGAGTTFAVSFPYIKQSDVKVTLNGANVPFTWLNGSLISVTPAPVGRLEIYRDTSKTDRLVDFQDDSVLNEKLLDDMSTQLFFITQEAYDEAAASTSTSANALGQVTQAVNTSNAASTTATSADSKATTALSTANTASTAATSAVNTANTASTTATSADSKATTALSTANTASTAAASAVSTANAATTTANSADTKATTALANANTALTNANAAVVTANAADSKATAADTNAANALAQVQAAVSGSVVSFNGRAGAVLPVVGDYTKAQVGLSNVDNTSDVDKPVSSATQTALATKADTTTVNAALATKADTTTVNAALATKADAAHSHVLGDLPATVVSTTGVQTLTNKTIAGATVDGNLVVSGTGRRILGDFSNATVASRASFQTTTPDSQTAVAALPSGAGDTAQFQAFNNSTPSNASFLGLAAVGTSDTRITSGAVGTGTALPLTIHTGGVERVRLMTNGDMGISFTSPRYRLDVNGVAGATGFKANTGAPNAANSSTVGYTFHGDGDTGMFSLSDGELRLLANSSERAVIGPNIRFYSPLTTEWHSRTLLLESVGGNQPGIGFHAPSTSTAAIFKFAGWNTAFECRNSADSGYINIAANGFVVGSDYRLKKDIAPLPQALDRVASLKPCSYTLIAEGTQAEGFIAHELQEVVPTAVFGVKDAVMDDGSPHYQGVDLSKVVPLLTAAIQEQQAIIASLTARIEALEVSA